MKHLLVCTTFVAILASPLSAATYSPGVLQFSTSGAQSAWGTGPAQQLSGKQVFSHSFDETATLGFMTPPTDIPNPLYVTEKAAYDTAYGVYLGLLWTHNNVTLPAYDAAKVAYDTCRDTLGPLCQLGSPSEPPAPTAPTPPTSSPTITVGKTGTTGTVDVDGKVGVEFSYAATAGSVTPNVDFTASAVIPDQVTAGTFFQLGSSTSALVGGEINAVSPGISAAINGILDVKVDASGEACLTGNCTSGSTTLVDVDETIELLSVDNTEVKFIDGVLSRIDPTGTLKLAFPVASANTQLFKGIPVTPQSSPAIVTVNGIQIAPVIGSPQTPAPPLIELANGVVGFPNLDFTGSLANNKISASGTGTLLDINLDLDGITNLINPTVPPGGASVTFGPAALNAAATLEAFDVNAGPTIDLVQDFDLMAGLDVTLQFDNPVLAQDVQTIPYICGFTGPITSPKPKYCTTTIPIVKAISSWTGSWNNLPSIALFSDVTVTPTFSLTAQLMSKLALQFGIELEALIGLGGINVGPLAASFGPILDFNFPIQPDWARVDLFNQIFSLGGFNSIVGAPFSIAASFPGTAPPGTPPTAPVPLPPAALLLLGGLGALRLLRRRKA